MCYTIMFCSTGAAAATVGGGDVSVCCQHLHDGCDVEKCVFVRVCISLSLAAYQYHTSNIHML